MTKITAHSLDIKPSQKLDLPLGAKLLTVNVDHRFNKCLLWTAEQENAPVTESVTFTMARLDEEVAGGTYVGTIKDNSGYAHVFAEWPAPIKSPTQSLAEAAVLSKRIAASDAALDEAVSAVKFATGMILPGAGK